MPSRIKLRPRTTPPPPGPDSETLFLDEADGVLKSIDSEGVVTAVEGASGGGAAEPGTVVVTEGLEGDIAAALEAANAMSAANPAATLADVSGMLSVVRTLTSAEILTLFSSPIELVPGVAGKVYWPIAALLHSNPVTTDYNLTNNNFWITPDPIGGFGLFGPTQSTIIGGNGADLLAMFATSQPNLSGSLESSVAGQPLIIFIESADPTDGDGTLDVTVFYREVDVS